jgi:hypothetical protein
VSTEGVAMNQQYPFALSLSKGSEETSRLHLRHHPSRTPG